MEVVKRMGFGVRPGFKSWLCHPIIVREETGPSP
jgi:hypothetical protein